MNMSYHSGSALVVPCGTAGQYPANLRLRLLASVPRPPET